MERVKMDEMEVLRFKHLSDYLAWLNAQSSHVRAKAEKFSRRFGETVVPVVLELCEDTAIASLGCDALTHIFVHPREFPTVVKVIVGEAWD